MIQKIVKKEDYRGYTIVVKKIFEDGIYTIFTDESKYSNWYCGYAVIPEDHPFYGEDYDEVEGYVDVHGGLTFSGELDGIDGFLLGFDCNHYEDSPEVQDEEYTLNECKRLVDQLIEIDKRDWKENIG
ncbi:hypothetical protein [Anaerococcus sp. Marseille-P3915]|uniref:hypothetical protein n=1 Tax=Anaerococcus sp. Marseille-P3915 TaxID=2057799 RepID=UPI000D0AC79A|nr:hypothetical protein [Anaerococcus sp. Marseille-P3915]